jgi:hypothetical protein
VLTLDAASTIVVETMIGLLAEGKFSHYKNSMEYSGLCQLTPSSQGPDYRSICNYCRCSPLCPLISSMLAGFAKFYTRRSQKHCHIPARPNLMWCDWEQNYELSQSRKIHLSSKLKGVWSSSWGKNSKIFSRLHDNSNNIVHFLCCNSVTLTFFHVIDHSLWLIQTALRCEN